MITKIKDYELPKTVHGLVLKFIWKLKYSFVGMISFAVIAESLDSGLLPYLLKIIIDKISLDSTGNTVLLVEKVKIPIIIAGFSWILMEIMHRIHGVFCVFFQSRYEPLIRRNVFNYAMGHSHRYFNESQSGNVFAKISDIARNAWDIIDHAVYDFIPALTSWIVTLTITCTIHYVIALIYIAWLIIYLTVALYFIPRIVIKAKAYANSKNLFIARIIDCINNNLNVRLFAKQRWESQSIKKFQYKEVDACFKSLMFQEYGKISFGVTCFVMLGLVLVPTELYLLKNGKISIGDLAFLLTGGWTVISKTYDVIFATNDFLEHTGICKNGMSILLENYDIEDKPGAKDINIENAKIEFKNVSFRYKTATECLFNDINLVINQGEKVGFVGMSGSGKTTIISLLLRYFDTDGEILIGNENIKDFTQNSLRKSISVIPQNIPLFHRSVLENIKYSKPRASFDQVVDAAKKAGIHDCIMMLQDKYDTIVGERGSMLSGGQVQRIAIARAILEDSPIVILDEATSALDSITEQSVQQSMNSLMKGKTSIIIAHRLSTLSMVDRIVVFDNGKIVEEGTIDELLKKSEGAFKKLWDTQYNGNIFSDDNIKERNYSFISTDDYTGHGSCSH